MSSYLDNLLEGSKGRGKRDLKPVVIKIDANIQRAFKQACSQSSVAMGKCVEALVLDFIQRQMLRSGSFQFGATAMEKQPAQRLTGT